MNKLSRTWRVVFFVILAHLLVLVLYHYGGLDVVLKPKKSEIKVEVAGVERSQAAPAQAPKPASVQPAQVKTEPIPEVKPEVKPVVKPEVKPEVRLVQKRPEPTPVLKPVTDEGERAAVTRPAVETQATLQVAVQPPQATVSVDSPPVLATQASYKAAYLNNPRPQYPSVAFKMRLEGKVMLMARVMPDGSCAQVKLVRSSGSDLLDQSALRTVARWKFVPATSEGKAVEQWVSIPIIFSIRPRKEQ